MNVQQYWDKRKAAGLDPLVYINLFTLRGVEVLCPFLTGIAPALRDQTDQSSKWLAYAAALGIDEVERAGNGTIDLGIQLKTRGTIDGRLIAEFVSYPGVVRWHGLWVATTNVSGIVSDPRLEIRQGRAVAGQPALSGHQLAAIFRVILARDQPTGVILNMANIWRNPPDIAAGLAEDTANVLLYVPDDAHKAFKEPSKAKFTRVKGRAYVDTTDIGR